MYESTRNISVRVRTDGPRAEEFNTVSTRRKLKLSRVKSLAMGTG